LRGRQGQRRAERRAHEGGGTGRGHGHRQHAGGELVEPGLACAPAGQAAGREIAEFEDAEQVQCDQREEQGQTDHHRRLLQLEAPADLVAAGAQQQQQSGQREEAQHHTGRVSRCADVALVRLLAYQRQRLQAEHREHAGHQIEQQAAQEGQQQAERQAGGRRRAAGGVRRVAGRAGRAGRAHRCNRRGRGPSRRSN
jgi:hypothetical protein